MAGSAPGHGTFERRYTNKVGGAVYAVIGVGTGR